MSKLSNIEIINRIKKNPIVDGIVLQRMKIVFQHEEAEDEIHEKATLYIVCNTNIKYIEKVTGEDFFGESKSIGSLYWDKRGYEGAIESPDIVPGPMELHPNVNMEAANMCAREIEHLSSTRSSVEKKEQSIFNKYIDANTENLNANIKLLEMIDDSIPVITTAHHEFDDGNWYGGNINYQNIILFDRSDKIELIPEMAVGETLKKAKKPKIVK